MRNGIAAGGRILAIDGFHEQEFQIVWRSHPAGKPLFPHTVFPERNSPPSSQFVPFLQVAIDNGLNKELFQDIEGHARFVRFSCTVIGATIAGSGFGGAWKAVFQFSGGPSK